jgi:UPF0271 protein
MPDAGRSIDLSADVGEATDDYGIAVESALLALVTTAHVACGGHVGDEASMRRTVQGGLDHGVSVGAHPAYPDRAGFGRQAMTMAPAELRGTLRAQIGDLVQVAYRCGTIVSSVKPHGALYADVARGEDEFAVLLEAMAAECEPGTALVLPSGARAIGAAVAAGVPVVREGFCDRAYRRDGGLMARSVAGAVYDDPRRATDQALSLAIDGTVVTDDGTVLAVEVDSLCLHGDSPNVVAMARAVRSALVAAGVGVGTAAAW